VAFEGVFDVFWLHFLKYISQKPKKKCQIRKTGNHQGKPLGNKYLTNDAELRKALTGSRRGLEYSEQLRLSPQELNALQADHGFEYVEFLHVYRHWRLGRKFE